MLFNSLFAFTCKNENPNAKRKPYAVTRKLEGGRSAAFRIPASVRPDTDNPADVLAAVEYSVSVDVVLGSPINFAKGQLPANMVGAAAVQACDAILNLPETAELDVVTEAAEGGIPPIIAARASSIQSTNGAAH